MNSVIKMYRTNKIRSTFSLERREGETTDVQAIGEAAEMYSGEE
jgi:hypothetical protein